MKNILVTINFEKNAARLIDKAQEMATAFGAKVWVLHVAVPASEDYIAMEVGPQRARDERAESRKREAILVKELAQGLRDKNIDAEGLVLEGPTAKTIRKKTAELGIDLVIAGHQKRNFFYKIFVGNTDRELIEDLNVPIMVVPLK